MRVGVPVRWPLLLLLLLLVVSVEATRPRFDIVDFGARSGGTDNTAVLAAVTAKAAAVGGATIVVPTGSFVIGTVSLPSNTVLLLESLDSVLVATTDVSKYPCLPSITVDTGVCDYCLLSIANVSGVQVLGPGALEGGFNSPPGHLVASYNAELNFLMPLDLPFPRCSPINCRIKLVVVDSSDSILFGGGAQLRNSPLWTLQVGRSEKVVIRDSFITSDQRAPNNDGIDVVSSRHILIENMTIVTGDDNIDLSTHLVGEPTFDVTVRGCRLSSTSCSLNTGMFALADIFNVSFSDNIITNSNRGVGIMPRMGSGNVYGYHISNTTISTRQYSSAWWGSGEVVYITALDYQQGYSGTISNIQLSNVSAVAANGVMLFSSQVSRISEILFLISRLFSLLWEAMLRGLATIIGPTMAAKRVKSKPHWSTAFLHPAASNL